MPFELHRLGEFRKAKAESRAHLFPLELGWVVVHPEYRRKGNGRKLVARAIEVAGHQGLYATTKSDSMRRMLAEVGFSPEGHAYPSTLDPRQSLSLFVYSQSKL